MSDPRENAPDKAERLGMMLIEPALNELFVDLDDQSAFDGFAKRFAEFLKVHPLATVKWTRSKSGNWHAYVTVPNAEFSMEQRIALQAALGSDPLREIIAITHLAGGYQYPCVFFEAKGHVRSDTPHKRSGCFK